jgi:hypothetical protein
MTNIQQSTIRGIKKQNQTESYLINFQFIHREVGIVITTASGLHRTSCTTAQLLMTAVDECARGARKQTAISESLQRLCQQHNQVKTYNLFHRKRRDENTKQEVAIKHGYVEGTISQGRLRQPTGQLKALFTRLKCACNSEQSLRLKIKKKKKKNHFKIYQVVFRRVRLAATRVPIDSPQSPLRSTFWSRNPDRSNRKRRRWWRTRSS